MKKILVPVDFSENTNYSIAAACDLAINLNCEIILFHSYFEMIVLQSINTTTIMNAIPVMDPGMVDALQENSEMEMRCVAEKIHEIAPQITVHQVVSPEEFSEKVVDICEKEKVFMIVMSATGSGKKDSFSGSAASSLFDCTPVPIVAIPENYTYNRDAGFKNTLYATDFSDAAQNEIRFILNHFINGNNKLLCCHLHFRDQDPAVANMLMEALTDTFVKEKNNGKISFEIINTDDVENTLETLTENNNIGLISFHEHHRSFFYRFFHRSTIKKNIFRFNIPLLVFRRFKKD